MSSATLSSATARTPKGGRKSASLPPKTVEYLKAWMMSPEHVAHPYPTEQEKAQIMADTGIELKQLTNWFVNNRKRYWKPRVEAKMQKKNVPMGSVSTPLIHGLGGLSNVSLNHMHRKPPQQLQQPIARTVSLPMLIKPSAPRVAQGTAGSLFNHTSCGPMTGGVIQVQAAPSYRDEDLHAISEGSGSSACNSDEESTNTPSRRRSSLAISCASLTRVGSNSAISTTAAATSTGYRQNEDVYVNGLCPPMNTIRFVSPPNKKGASTRKTLLLNRARDSACADVNQDDTTTNPAPRKRARTDSRPTPNGEVEWRRLCELATSLYCESLPALDDAAVMFGYVS